MRSFLQYSTLFLILTSFTYSQPDAKSYYESGVTSLNKKEYIQAIGEFTNAISMNPNFADAYFYRAMAKDLLGKAMGFSSPEQCYDLITAMKLGKGDAVAKIEKNCIGECHNIQTAMAEPEIVLCADFSSQNLADLPEGAQKMDYVTKLNFNNNNATTLSGKFEHLTGLTSLDLSHNKLTTIPSFIGKLTELRELNLNKNQIKELPYEFGNLKHIKTLNLRQNGLTNLPKSVAMLTSLENLDLAINPLTSLPLEISNLKNLKTLTLVGHEMSSKEQQKVKALLPNTKIYFE